MARHDRREGQGRVDAALARETYEASDIRRLERALEYLLISNLNARAPMDAGPAGNQRLIALFLSLVKRLGPAIFLDIGANDGSTAVAIKSLLPDCAVTAFEANPTIHAANRDPLQAQGVVSLNLAVAARSGEATIFAPRALSNAYVNGEIVASPSIEPVNTGKSSLLRRDEVATYDEYQVAATTLDAFLGAATPACAGTRDVALWIDVEGAAHAVLEGAAKALERAAIIFIESENHRFWVGQKPCDEVARALIAAGFLPIARDREYGDKQFNTIFLHHGLVAMVYPELYGVGDKAGATSPALKPWTIDGAADSSPTAPTRKSYRSLAACLISEIPVFVPVFNNPTYAANMLRQLKGFGIRNVFLVDNASTYPGMADFLDRVASDVTVIRLPENKGPYDLVLSETNYACLPDIFCVTDPDLEFRADMPPDFLFDLLNLTNRFGLGKVGLALDLSDRGKMLDEKFLFGEHYFHIWEWEGQFWREPVDVLVNGSPVYKAKIDTTFALYNKRFFKRENFWDALRVAGQYTCRHLPWYRDSGLPTAEENHYKATQKFSYYMV